MNAYLPLAARLRTETESRREIREALVRREGEVIEDQRAIDAALLGHAIRVTARSLAGLRGTKPAGSVPTKVAAPAVAAGPAPSPDTMCSALGLT